MTRGFWRDPDKYLETYWSRLPGVWVHGDWASVDEDGFWFLHGRSDDTINIAGKRIGPAELESAAVGHPAVREAAAIGVPHEVKGETAWIFCCLLPGAEATEADVAAHVAAELGKAFKPTGSFFVDALPKTRSAKIVRRAVKATALGTDPGDLSSLENPESLDRSEQQLADGVAVITGGGRGIGANDRALARGRRLVDRRHRARSRGEIDAVAAETGGRAVEMDVASRESVEHGFEEMGHVDLLVANAGVGRRRRLVAHVRGERARRASLLRGSARGGSVAHRHHRQRRRLPAGREQHVLYGVQGSGAAATPRR